MHKKAIALTTILFIVLSIVFSTLVYSGLSVVYRTDFPTSKHIDPNEDTSSYITLLSREDQYGVNKHCTSTANNLNLSGFPFTLQYNNGEFDYWSWHFEDLSKVPQNTIVYVYVNISQIAIGEGAKATIFQFTQYASAQDSVSKNYFVVANETHIWFAHNDVDEEMQTLWLEAENYAQINATTFDPDAQLIICLKCKFLDSNYKIYLDRMYLIQHHQIISSYQIDKTIDGSGSTKTLPTVVVIAKYQVTVADSFVSYDAPDVLLSQEPEESQGNETGTPHWLNFTVNPPSYTIKYYNYSTMEIIKIGTGTLSEQYPYNSTILVKVFTDEGTKKFESKYVMTRDYDIYLDFEYEREKYNLTVKIYDEQLREMTADYIYIDSKMYKNTQKVSVMVTEGSHRIRVKREGYKEFDNVVQVNSNVTYCITLVPESSEYSSDISKDTPKSPDIEEKYYTNETLYNPPTEIQKDFFGFIFRNERSTDVVVRIYGTKVTLMGGWYKIPIAETTVPANGNKTLVLYVDDVNQAMNYKLGEFGQCFIIEDKSTGKTIVEADMNAFKNQFRIIVIRDDVGMLIGGKGAMGGTALFGTTLGILYMLLPIMIILSLVSALTKMIKKSTR